MKAKKLAWDNLKLKQKKGKKAKGAEEAKGQACSSPD
jgi:hypothetical protein